MNPKDPGPVVERLRKYHSELNTIINRTLAGGEFEYGTELLKRWEERCSKWISQTISEEEARKFRHATTRFSFSVYPEVNFKRDVEAFGAFLSALYTDLETNPDEYLVGGEAVQPGDTSLALSKGMSDTGQPVIFVGHGRSPLWMKVQRFLEKDHGLRVQAFEEESRVGKHIVEVLEGFLAAASFAILIFTGDDETSGGELRARQNVVHEAGLFQGKLGFSRTVLIVQSGIEEFSNIAGLQQIRFTGQQIEQSFYELARVLKREGIIK